MEAALVLILIAFSGAVYFIPAIIAFSRGHQSALAILTLNLLLGWTFFGWVVALVWSISAKTQIARDFSPSVA